MLAFGDQHAHGIVTINMLDDLGDSEELPHSGGILDGEVGKVDVNGLCSGDQPSQTGHCAAAFDGQRLLAAQMPANGIVQLGRVDPEVNGSGSQSLVLHRGNDGNQSRCRLVIGLRNDFFEFADEGFDRQQFCCVRSGQCICSF